MKTQTDRVECKSCKELIKRGAIKCRYCGERQINKRGGFHALQVILMVALLLLVPSLVFASIWIPRSSLFKSKSSEPNELSFEEGVLSKVNVYRKENGMLSVERENETCGIAKRMSTKENPKTIITNDYSDLCPTCNSVGMNLATDITGVEETINMWKSNTLTNKNMLSDFKYGCIAKAGNQTVLILTSKDVTATKAGGSITTKSGVGNSQIECIGPDGKRFKTSMEGCRELNEKWGKPMDYMVDCNFSSECGGPRYVKKSECVDCNKTKSGAVNNQPNIVVTQSASKKTAVYITVWNTTYYCPQEIVDAVKTADAQYKSATTTKSSCDSTAFSEKLTCSTKCGNDYYPDQTKIDTCRASCDSTYTYSLEMCNYPYNRAKEGFMSIIKNCSYINI